MNDVDTDERPILTLVDLLGQRAQYQSDQTAYVFLADGEVETAQISYGELDRQAQAIAAELQKRCRPGERALLLYPSGLEFIAAFFGCLYAGVIAVPVAVPRRHQHLARWQAIATDAQATLVLTTEAIREKLIHWGNFQSQQRCWLTSENISFTSSSWVPPVVTSETIAFLQYTSGSTGKPKGVIVTHRNLLHNEGAIQAAFNHSQQTIVVGWLPLFHDMGLIGNVLQPMYLGVTSLIMPPTAFLQKPWRWLQAVTRYRATTSGGPNFAYDLCVEKIPPHQRAELDLSSWQVAFNGAEPIRAETLKRFTEAFEPYGFRPQAFYPCYGMAEATLFISGGLATENPVICQVERTALEENRVADSGSDVEIVGCGKSWFSQIAIACPETFTQLGDGVGEIWVASESVAQGYWNQPHESELQAYLADTGAGPFLRTGDLGFLREGELFVTGRLKDLIIIRGRNIYPQDLELTVEKSHPALRQGGGAAFSVEGDGGERLVVAQEVERTYRRKLDVDETIAAIRGAVSQQHELDIYAVLLLVPGSIPKTSSGKIQRYACRQKYLANSFSTLGASVLSDSLVQDNQPERLAFEESLRDRLAQITGIAAAKIAPHTPLTSLGLNSLQAIEIQNFVEAKFNLYLPIESFWEDLSITRLADWIGSNDSGTAVAAPASVHKPVLAQADAPRSDMQFSLFYFSSNEAEFEQHKYRLLIEGAKFADQNGLSAVWVPERHFHAFGGLYPNPSVLGAALAMVTEKIRIRAGSVVLPLHHPMRVAEEWSVVDNLSQGRIDLAFARGWNPNDFVFSPSAYDNATEVLHSGIETVRKLWRGESLSLPNGEGKLADVRLHPLPCQPELPIWLTCSGGKDRFIEAGKLGVNILTALLFQPLEELAEKIALYRQARKSHGHDSGHVTLMLHTFVGEDLDVVRDQVKQPFKDYLKSSVNLWRQGAKSLEDLNEPEREQLLSYAFERYFQTSALFGTPQTCHSLVRQLQKIGVNEIACLIDFGVETDSVLSALDSLKQLKQLSTAVTGELQGIEKVTSKSPHPLIYPLSYGQQALWFLYQLNPDAAYNTAFAVRICSSLDVKAWRKALQALVDRHPSLRTTFSQREGKPVQSVQETEIPFETISAQGWTESELKQQVIQAYQRPFNLEQSPPLRASLFTGAKQDVFLLVIHHIVRDGWSMLLLIDELRQLYLSRTDDLAIPVEADYQDYVKWQTERLASDGERLWRYWQRQLADLSVLDLPSDRARSSQPKHGGTYTFKLASGTQQLQELAQAEGATLFMTLLAAFQVLLHRYTGQDDIVVGSPTAGRSAAFARTVGYFVNLVALRAKFAENITFKAFLAQVRQTVLEAITYQDYPLSLLVERLQPQRDSSHSSLFNVTFVLIEEPPQFGHEVTKLLGSDESAVVDWGGLKLQPFVIPQEEGQFDLSLEVGEAHGCVFKYNRNLFDEATIARMAGHFQTLLEGIVANPEQPVSQLPLLTEAEQDQLVTWNATQVEYPQSKCIHALFEEQVEKTPDAVAVEFANQQLTYRQLNVRANQVAHTLQGLGVGPEVLVGICVRRSLDLVVGLLGILKAGGAYVPLDPAYPNERLAFMLGDAQPKVLLTQQPLVTKRPQQTIVCLDDEQISKASTDNPNSGVTPENLAYVVYTSGTTGKPKGVLVPHSGLLNLVFWHQRTFAVTASDRATQLAGIAFDALGWELYPYLTAGATVCLVEPEVLLSPEQLQAWLIRQQISISFLPTPLAERVLSLEWSEPVAVRVMLTGGDKLHSYPSASVPFEVVNNYGPTENTVVTTSGIVAANQTLSPHIGRPIANTQVYILDSSLQPVPIGVPGELYIGGAGLARGYLNRPELTAERFIPNPFENSKFKSESSADLAVSVEEQLANPKGQNSKFNCLYKTGDLVRYLPDGNIEYLGRLDHQVKIRGFRIELGEIEAVLAECPQVQQAVVVAREDTPGNQRLVAYVVPSQEKLTGTELRGTLGQKLPEYMVPAIVFLSALPLTPNGKVDRRALPVLELNFTEEFVPPRSPTQAVLAAIWAEVLGVKQVGVDDNFFELGGHSLLVTQVISRVRSALDVELPVQSLFTSPTIETLSQQIDSRQTGLELVPPLAPVHREEPLPLSFAQQRLWFLEQLEGDAVYNVSGALRLSGTLQVEALEQALRQIVARHEVLRTCFPSGEGAPMQVISDVELSVPVVDLQSSAEPAQVQRLIEQEAQTPFDLARGPLLRVKLLRLAPAEHVLAIALHHIVCDGWSLNILMREVSEFYTAFASGEAASLPELPLQYADFAVWQRRWFTKEVLAPQLEYWQQQLEGAPPLLELPTDRTRPPVQSFSGRSESFTLPPELTGQLKSLSQQSGTTLFMTLLAAFGILLSRYSRQSDLVIGSPIANRNQRELEPLIGFFANTLALRLDLQGTPSFSECLGRVRKVTLEAYTHQNFPFEQLVEELQPERSLSHSPLFQVMFVFEGFTEAVVLPGLEGNILETAPTTAKFDLTLAIRETESGLQGRWEYSCDLFEAATICRMSGHFQTLLAGIVANPEQPVTKLPLLTEPEHQLLVEWNATSSGYPPKCLHELFEEQVERTPDAVAVVFEESRLTYRELNARANQLAHHLQGLGVEPEVLVGICAERSLDLVVGLLGILKAGGAYLPLDPSYPPERLAFMLDDAQVTVLLTQQELLAKFPKLKAQVVCLDEDWQNPENPVRCTTPDSLAYVIYTSGSTGKPKGVAIAHRSPVALMFWAREHFSAEELAGVLASTSICFDLSVFELFVPLSWGGRVILAQDALQLPNLPAANDVTLVNTVPSAIAELLRTGSLPERVQTVNLAGEALQNHLVQQLYQQKIEKVYNLYGPSEDTTYSTFSLVKKGAIGTPAIGRPIANTQVYILDSQLQPVPIGVPGELYIGGAGLARGYLNRPELTQEKFISNPFVEGRRQEAEGRRKDQCPMPKLYKTGDLARYLPTGEIEYLGRLDHQVKLRGFRIELGEIEAVLTECPQVQQAVVVAREDTPSNQRLVAYVVPSQKQPTCRELRDTLRQKLPEYMVPAAFKLMEALPLTPNGKIDRRALPAPEPTLTEEFVPPHTPTQEVLAAIWAEVLGIKQVGIHDNFFNLGGHSLLATQVISRVRSAFELELPLRSLFASPTVEALSQQIESDRQVGFGQIAIKPVSREKLPLSFAQQRLWFLEQLEGDAAYNMPAALHLSGSLDRSALERSFAELGRRHEVLRTRFPMVEGSPVQVIETESALSVCAIDLQNVPAAQQTAQVQQLAEQEAQTSFDLAQGHLLRVVLLQLAPHDHVLLLTMHHIICDGWSLGLLMREVSGLYRGFASGEAASVPELPVQYADFAVWQRRWLKGEVKDTQLNYWKQQLEGAPPLLELPTDRTRPPVQSFHGRSESFRLDRELSTKLKALSQQSGTTLFMTLLAAFGILLSRYSRQSDLVIGSPIANRNRRELEPLIGFFANTLALRLDLQGTPSFRECLERVRKVTLEAYTHQDFPFEQLVEELQPERSLSHSPLFQVMFALQNAPLGELVLPGLSWSPLETETVRVRFDLVLSMSETEGGLSGTWDYSSDLFESATINRMAEHFQTLLEGIVAHPEQPVDHLPLVTEPEQPRQERVEYSSDQCLHQRFEEQVERTPDAVAIAFEGSRLTYRELNARANQLAHRLQGLGVEPDVLVGICVERSLEMVVGLLGILKAGGAYLPLDPSYPTERLAFMLDDAQVKILLTTKNLIAQLPPCEMRLCIDAEEDHESEENPISSVSPHNLAYVIYTSGTTGTPKGVLIEHQNVVRLFATTEVWFKFNDTDVWTLFHSYAFDFSVWELWGALLFGGRLVIVPCWVSRSPEAFYTLLVNEGVTVLNQTPSAFRQLMWAESATTTADQLSSLRLVIFGGEALEIQSLQPWFERHGNQPQLVNMYGITETTVHVTYRPLNRADLNSTGSAIGVPLPDLQVYILDRHLQPLPIGVPGEMYVGGAGLARGYLNRPDLTAQKFIPNPFGEGRRQRAEGRRQRAEGRRQEEEDGVQTRDLASPKLYKTGDLARYLPNGDIEYLGRIDQQVNLRGFRIELGEIEAVLAQHPGVRESVVVAQDGVEQRLVAYVVPDRKQALPVHQLLRLTNQGKLADKSLYELPNGMAIAHLNKAETDFVYQEIFADQSYLKHGITIESGDCIFDVGANIGLFTLFAAHICPSVEVYAFEPIPPVFELLRLNTELYGLNAKLFAVGLSGESTSDTFTYYPHVSVISGRFADAGEEQAVIKSFLKQDAPNDLTSDLLDQLLDERLQSEQFTCPLKTVSQAIAENGVERIDLLKIDVEKSEQEVLAGIREQDWSKIQQIVVEVHDQGGRLAEITQLLEKQGYELTIAQERGLEKTGLYTIYARRTRDLEMGSARGAGTGHGARGMGAQGDGETGSKNLTFNLQPANLQPHAPCPQNWSSANSFIKELRRHLKEKLPEYMIPSAFVPLETLPLTTNGKLDRRALPAPKQDNTQASSLVLPRTETEETIAGVWREVLGIEQIGIDDNFFELGGHSLLATQAIARLRNCFNLELPLRCLFENPTLVDLAAAIAAMRLSVQLAASPHDLDNREEIEL